MNIKHQITAKTTRLITFKNIVSNGLVTFKDLFMFKPLLVFRGHCCCKRLDFTITTVHCLADICLNLFCFPCRRENNIQLMIDLKQKYVCIDLSSRKLRLFGNLTQKCFQHIRRRIRGSFSCYTWKTVKCSRPPSSEERKWTIQLFTVAGIPATKCSTVAGIGWTRKLVSGF